MEAKKPRDYFSKIRLLNGFNSDQINAIEKFSSIKNFAANKDILIQGEENINLYFLIMGKLNVQVDGNTVAALDQLGDVIGEMSIITEKAVSATITSETPIKVIEVDIKNLNYYLAEKKDKFNESLFRAFAVVLSEKLRITNQKAKYFEEFSGKNLAEVYQGQELTLKKLEEIYSQNLVELHSLIEAFGEGFTHQRAEKALSEIEFIQKSIEPIVKRFQLAMERKNKTVLLAESNKKQQSVAKMALGGTGINLEIANNIEDAKQKISTTDYDIIFVNSEMIPLIDEFKERENQKIALMTSYTIAEYIPELSKLKSLPNIVSRDDEDRYFTSKSIVTTVTKLAGDDIFGLSKYLSWGVDIQQFDVTGSEMRKILNEDMNKYFIDLGVRNSRLSPVCTVAEELLMNAVYDAPVNEAGESTYNHLERSVKIELEIDQYSKFSYATDGVFIGISVEDPFGSLDGKIVMKYLESCYSGAAGSLNKEKGGAGRGLHMIVEMSDLVVFNVKPNHRTEVISLFHIDSKASLDRPASFHYFCEGV